MQRRSLLIACCTALILSPVLLRSGCAQQANELSSSVKPQTSDVIYGRKDGMALTMDVFKPEKKVNGAAILWMVSGGWYSSHDSISIPLSTSMINVLTERGYTVFAVVHGSQPKYTIPEILPDIQRATRYVRYHAADYGIDANRLGITGASSGGHLSLMQGMTGNDGNPTAPDPVDRVSSRIQAIACFFPPTDFLNYGKAGEDALGRGTLKDFAAPFAFEPNDPQKKKQMGMIISPINHVTASAPPTLIIHGDKDPLVPIQQGEIMIAKLKEANVPAELIVKKDGEHGWVGIDKDMPKIADWFDKYLAKK